MSATAEPGPEAMMPVNVRAAAVADEASIPIPWLIKRNTVLLALAQAFVGLGSQMVPTLGAIMVQQLTSSAALAGLGSSLMAVSRLIVAYPIGYVTDRFGRRAGLMLGLVFSLLGSFTIALSMFQGSLLMMASGMLVFGLGVGAAQQLRLAAADMYLPKRRGEGLGYVLTGSLIGAMAAPLVIEVGQTWAERIQRDPLGVVWLVVPVVLVPSMVLVALVRPDPRAIAQHLERYYPGYVPVPSAVVGTVPVAGVRAWMRNVPLLTAFVSNCSAQGVMTMMMAMTPLALAHHGHTLPFISLAVSIHVIGMFGLSVPFGRLSDRVGRRIVMLLGIGVVALGSILVPTSPDYVTVTSGIFLVGVGWSCINVASSALIADVVGPRERGRAIGTNDMFSQAAAILLPLLAGPLVALVGLPSLAVVAILVLAPPLLLLVRLREPSPGSYDHA
ncbi:MAG: MFS transporter [Chloroflexi bacterium]|nr:MFS transporter [Chloroflexota bacterium]